MSEQVDRRDLLKTGVAAGAAMAFTAASYDRVLGANENLRVGFVGVGGRCQQNVDVILKMVQEKKGVAPVAACDVWDGDPSKGKGKGQGLFPTAKRCGINTEDKDHVVKDYRRLLDLKEVDVVCAHRWNTAWVASKAAWSDKAGARGTTSGPFGTSSPVIAVTWPFPLCH